MRRSSHALWVCACLMAVACLLTLALASCDASARTVAPATTATTATTTTATTATVSLRVTRHSASMDPYPPFEHTVTSALAVERLYDAALALPQNVGVRYCPIDFGLTYGLAFTGEPAATSQMTLQAQGCELLTVRAGDVRRTDDAFIALFLKTVNLAALTPQS